MNSRDKKIFGMTVIQLVVLGCLALAACGTLGGGIWFVVSSLSGGVGATVPMTESPLLTTPEPDSTETPVPAPTQTPILYESLIPAGWQQHKSEQIEFWLPNEFYEVDIRLAMDEMVEYFEKTSQDDLAEAWRTSPPPYLFWLEANSASAKLFKTQLTVLSVVPPAGDFEAYLQNKYSGLPATYQVVDSRVFEVPGYQANRTLLESNVHGLYVGYVSYAIYDGNFVWLLEGASHFNEFYTWQPTFDKMARTFRVIKQ